MKLFQDSLLPLLVLLKVFLQIMRAGLMDSRFGLFRFGQKPANVEERSWELSQHEQASEVCATGLRCGSLCVDAYTINDRRKRKDFNNYIHLLMKSMHEEGIRFRSDVSFVCRSPGPKESNPTWYELEKDEQWCELGWQFEYNNLWKAHRQERIRKTCHWEGHSIYRNRNKYSRRPLVQLRMHGWMQSRLFGTSNQDLNSRRTLKVKYKLYASSDLMKVRNSRGLRNVEDRIFDMIDAEVGSD